MPQVATDIGVLMDAQEYRHLVYKSMKEKDFQEQVKYVARSHGWLVYHTHDSRRSEPGFPDLVMVRDDEVIFVELKSETGRVSPSQRKWLDALSNARRVRVPPVWRPSDMDDIMAMLR